MQLAYDRTPTSEPNVFFVKGDLLTHPCDLIIHQTNCLTVTPHGLATEIFKFHPEADLYSKRRAVDGRNLAVEEDRGVPGTAVITGKVAAIFGQWKPGKCQFQPFNKNYPEYSVVETSHRRVLWFSQGLQHLEEQLKNLQVKTVGFPYQIGCGLAGGEWPVYSGVIADFARRNPRLVIDIVVKTPE